MLIKVDRSVLRSRPCSFLRPFFPFFQTGDSPGNSERLHPIADPSFYNSKTPGACLSMAILAANGRTVVMCLIGSWFVNQHEESLSRPLPCLTFPRECGKASKLLPPFWWVLSPALCTGPVTCLGRPSECGLRRSAVDRTFARSATPLT